jgi:predicted permease
MDSFLSDIRYGFRSLGRTPGFTAVVVLTLALGIGANAAIFSVLNAVVLRPLPYPEPDRLVILQEEDEALQGFGSAFSPADYLDLRRLSRSFEELAGHRGFNYKLSGPDGRERIRGASVTPSFFRVFGVEPILGRSFLPEGDPATTGARVVLLSYGTWQGRFGGDRSLLGQSITLDGEPHEIVGVAPALFDYPSGAEMWVRSYRDDVPEPGLNLGDDLGAVRDLAYFTVIGRLAAGVPFGSAQAEMEVMATRLAEAAGDGEETSLRVMTLHEELFGEYRPVLILLLGAVGLVLLIACANVANLLLARSRTREREVAIRTALGAGRGRLIRQLFTENMILGLLAGAAGLLLAVWGIDALVRLAPPGIPRLTEVEVDIRVLLFTFTISILTAILYGLLPAFRMSKPDLHLSLKDAGRTVTEGHHGRRFRRGIVISEVALSLLLLCAAGLLAKSLVRLLSVDPGFRPENLLVMRIDLSGAKYDEDARATAFVREVVERVTALPGVTSAGTALALPFSGSAVTLNYSIEGKPETLEDDVTVEYQTISPGYFRTMGIPLLRGRVLTERDDADAPHVVVINEAMARRHWPGEDPIGRRIVAWSATCATSPSSAPPAPRSMCPMISTRGRF